MSRGHPLLFLHHHRLPKVSGVSVFLDNLAMACRRLDSRFVPEVLGIEDFASADELLGKLRQFDGEGTLIGCNLHLEYTLDFAAAVLGKVVERGWTVILYVFDYWPGHRSAIRELTRGVDCPIVASSEFVKAELERDGFTVGLVHVGIDAAALERPPDGRPARDPTGDRRRVVGAVGRVVPRKCSPEIVTAFILADLHSIGRLHLRLLPSHLQPDGREAEIFAQIEGILDANPAAREAIVIDRAVAGRVHPTRSTSTCAPHIMRARALLRSKRPEWAARP